MSGVELASTSRHNLLFLKVLWTLYCIVRYWKHRSFLSSDTLPNQRFQQDDDPKHTSRYTKQFYNDNNINWLKTQPESPDIELLWHELKWYIRKHVKPKTKEELVAGIREFWATRVTKGKCQPYIEHVRTKVLLRVVELEGQATGI